MKNSYRLDYTSLAEVLGQRTLVEPQRLKLALQTSLSGPIPFPEVLVVDNLIGDWDLSRVVCEIFGLPFLPVDLYTPSMDALNGLDQEFLRKHRLVPLSRHKRVLTICMPGLVSAEVLGLLASTADLHVVPVVGSVNSNNKWLAENMAAPDIVGPEGQGGPGDWNKIFDEGDAAVLLNLDQEPQDPSSEAA